MASIYDKSSLVLIPSGTKTGKVFSQKPVSGDGDFTFTRASAATRVNADGNIEKETGNLLLQSNTFSNSSWNKNAGGAFTSGQAGYDGTNDAWQFNVTTASNSGAWQNVTFSGVATFSAYFKKGTIDKIGFTNYAGSSYECWFDLTNGTIGQQTGDLIDAKIVSVGGGWYRCSITDIASGANYFQLKPSNAYSGVSTAGNIYIQDAQVEQGLVARDYIETTTAAVYGGITDNTPRLDYTDSSCPALLLEPQRTNVLPHSEYFDSWIGSNRSSTPNEIASPEGISNGTKLAASGGQAYYAYQSNSTSGANVFSVFLKYGTKTIQSIYAYSSGSYFAQATFNLSTGVVNNVSNGTASIEDYGNGWYRCSVQGNAAATLIEVGIEGIGASDYTYAYGAQLEAGSYATSYIPTYGSSVSRVADASSITSASDLIGQTEGSFYAEIDFTDTDADQMYMTLSDGTSANRIHIGYDSTSNWIYCNVKAANLQQALLTSASPSEGIKKIAVTYAQDYYVMYINGSQISIDGNANVPTLTRINIGGYFSTGFEYPVRQNLLFKTRLSNEELAALTTI